MIKKENMIKEKVMYDASNIVEFRTNIEGWVGTKSGLFYGKDEGRARYNECTHKTCDCGNAMKKGWLKCETCRKKTVEEQYQALEYRELEFPVVIFRDDTYFWNEEELGDYIYDNNEERKENGEELLKFSDLKLVNCTPNYLREFEFEFFGDELPEDYEFPLDIVEKVKEFNEFIHKQKPVSYSPSKYRTEYKDNE